MSKLRQRMQEVMELRGYSPNTIKRYIHCVAKYCKYYNSSPDKLSDENIRAFLLYLKREKQISPSGMNQMYSGLKILYTMVLKRKWDATIPRMKRVKRLPLVLSKSEINSILKAKNNLKHKVILKLLYTTGMRQNELTNLKLNDIDSKRMVIRINQGKGKKDRLTILSKSLLKELREYYLEYKPKIWLFNGQTGEKYSNRSIQHIFIQAKKKAKITSECSCHTLRHSFATHLLEQGVDILNVFS